MMGSPKSYIALAFLFSCYGMIQISASTCPTGTHLISMKDMQDAAEFTKISYITGDVVSTSNGFQVIETIHKRMSEDNEIKAVVAENVEQNEMVIAFRGTSGHDQLFEIAKTAFRQVELDDWFGLSSSSGIKANKYFLDAFNLILPALEPYLQGNKKIIFTGHSLGGALASLLALYTSRMENGPWSNSETCLITFGQPKIGNNQFAAKHDQLIPSVKKMIFIVGGDPVPRLPFSVRFLGIIYSDISGRVVLKKNEYEVKLQTIVDKNAYVCTFSTQCDVIVKNEETDAKEHEIDVYTSFMTSASKWYNKNGLLQSSAQEALAEIC